VLLVASLLLSDSLTGREKSPKNTLRSFYQSQSVTRNNCAIDLGCGFRLGFDFWVQFEQACRHSRFRSMGIYRSTERTRTTNGSERAVEHGEATVPTAPALHRCFADSICADKVRVRW